MTNFLNFFHRKRTKTSLRAILKENKTLKRENGVLKKQFDTADQQLAETRLRHNLTAQLLSAKNQNEGVSEYQRILNNDFLTFANEVDALADEAAAMLQLQEIGDELKVVGAYPEFYKKRSIAIAGGFSAGKSEFISSLFADAGVRLPIGIEPTTAIPTYVLNSRSKTGVWACSSNGGMVDLLALDSDFQSKLSHNFIRSFGFNLKSIMPFLFLATPIAYEHLCVIDTPGYNPSDTRDGFQGEDIKTAEEFIHNAEALIWLIGLDANGTISKSDLTFLEKVTQDTDKPLYVVLNKADLRPHDQLEDIMDEIVGMLDGYDIEVAGVSAYSSVRKQEFNYYKQSLTDFLSQMDSPSDKHETIIRRLYAVDEKYQRAILRKIKQDKQLGSVINGVEADLLQEGFDDLGSDLYAKLSRIKSLFVSQQHSEQLKQLGLVMDKFTGAVNQVFGQTADIPRHILNTEDIELDERYSRLTQKDELFTELMDYEDFEELFVEYLEYWQSLGVKFSETQKSTIYSLLNKGKVMFSLKEWQEERPYTSPWGNDVAKKELLDLAEQGVFKKVGEKFLFVEEN